MGDRALFVITNCPDDASNEEKFKSQAPCAAYVHWHGSEALELLERAGPNLRAGDPHYAMARLIGYLHTQMSDPQTGLGVLEAPCITDWEEDFTSYSHGDAGVIVFNCGTGMVTTHAGYHSRRNVGSYTLPTFRRY